MSAKKQDKADQKLSTTVHIEDNSFKDEGDGVISFPYGQVISDETKQRNGTSYDIASMEIDEFNGTVTADHYDMIQSVVAKTLGLAKRGSELVISGLQFAVKESAFAQLTYDLMRGGYVKDLSIETYGPWPDSEDNVYKDAKLCGLSVVVTGNNKSATVNSLVQNSLATARKNGLDTTEAEKALGVDPPEPKPEEAEQQTNNKKDEEEMSYKTIKNSRDFAVKVTYKNAAGDETTTELAPGTGVDVAEDQATAVEKQVNDAQAPKVETPAVDVNAMKAELEKGFDARLEAFQKDLADKNAVEPTFKVGNSRKAARQTNMKGSDLESMDWKERTALQLQSIHSSFRGDRDAGALAYEINRINFEGLQKEGVISNSLDLPDLGNFVIPREMVSEIKEQGSNYRPLLDVFRFEETMSLETAWLKGTGEISMSDVDMDDNDDNLDLKPISNPTFATDLTRLKEFAAVTPVKASAIRFAAVDLVGHLTTLYKRAYDRRLAQSVIGRLELAVESNGHTTAYNFSSAAGGNVESLVALITAWSSVSENVTNGYYILTQASYLHLLSQSLRAGISGPLASIFTQGADSVPRFLARPYIIVPNDIMPNLNTAGTKSWSFEGESVTVNSGVFFADPNDFVGKVSGGLNFQVSDVAPYEESGTVKSAFQRDELVFRGYGYRASGLYFEENVAAVTAPGIS